MRTLSTVIRSIQPNKAVLQQRFFHERAKEYGLPDAETGVVPSQEHLAIHTCQAMRKWARRFDIPRGDEDVLMSLLGTVLGISSADSDLLDTIPIDDITKDIVLTFFGKPLPKRNMTLPTIQSLLSDTSPCTIYGNHFLNIYGGFS